MSASDGEKLIEDLKAHVLDTMRHMPDCAPGGPGRPNKDIGKASGLALDILQRRSIGNSEMLDHT